MALKVTMAGSLDKTHWAQRGTLRIRDPLCAASTLSLTFRDMKAATGYRPAIDDNVLIENPVGTPIFHGVVVSPEESGRRNVLSVQIDARGMARRCDERFVLKTYTAGADPDTVLADLVATYLAADSITAAAIVGATGTLPALTYDYRQLTEVLNELCALLGNLVWRITPGDELQLFKPGSGGVHAAPWSIADADGHIQGEPRRRKSRTNYANRVILRFGTGQGWIIHEPHAGNGVTRVFVLDVPAVSAPNIVWLPDGVTGLPVGVYGVDVMPWTFEASTNSLHQLVSEPVIGVGEYIWPDYLASWPGTVVSTGTGPVVEVPLEEPTVFEGARAQALADAYRAQREITTEEFFYGTKTAGLAPGQSQAIVCSRRAVNGTYLLTELQTLQEADINRLYYDVSAVLGTIYPGSWRDLAKALGGGSGVTSVVSGGGGGGGSISALHAHLGGSRTDGLATASWVPIINYATFIAPISGSYTFRVEVETTNATTTVQARLYDVTAAAAVTGSTTTASAATTWTEFSQAVTLVAGHRYRAEMIGSDAAADIQVGQATMVM